MAGVVLLTGLVAGAAIAQNGPLVL